VKLRDVRSLEFKPGPRLVMHDGKIVEGAVSGLEAVAVRLGELTLAVDLTKSRRLRPQARCAWTRKLFAVSRCWAYNPIPRIRAYALRVTSLHNDSTAKVVAVSAAVTPLTSRRANGTGEEHARCRIGVVPSPPLRGLAAAGLPAIPWARPAWGN
jgi:hypothetical protein